MKTVMKYILPPILVFLGVVALVVLVKSKPQAARAASEIKAPLVDFVVAEEVGESALVRGQGAVVSAREVTILPEVSGQVVAIHPNLVAGGRLAAGEVLLRIDPRDYQLRVQQQSAQVEQARFNIEVERSRRKIAEREWELIGDSVPTDEEGRTLALRQPHERNARAGLSAATSGLTLLQLSLSRTSIEAPFNALVMQEGVDVGQVVGPASRVATLVDTDRFHVQVNIPVEQLGWVVLPTEGAPGSKASVIQSAGEASMVREGRVVRLLGDVDPVGRMARILIAVDDPLGLKAERPGLPLLLGAFVNVSIEGRPIGQGASIPREALREDDRVFVADKDGVLDIRQVEVIWRQTDTVVVKGVAVGERVITSRLDAPVKGMAVRTESAPAPEEARP